MFTPMLRLAHRTAETGRPASMSMLGNTAYFSSSARRMNANPKDIRGVLNRPEITPLFLFTGTIIFLGVFFGGRHLVKDKELQLDHAHINQLQTDTKQLNYDQMAHVADDPDGKLTKQSIDEERKRSQRLKDLREEKEEKSNDKL